MARKPAPASDKAGKPARKRVSTSTTPGPETLSALKPEILIRLILDEVTQNPAFKKRVSAAIAGTRGPDAVAALIDRRLSALEKARGFVDWEKSRAFAADLKATVSVIESDLAPLDAAMAVERLRRFLGGSGSVLERVDDSSGRIHAIYENAADAAYSIAERLPPETVAELVQSLVAALNRDGFGLLDALIRRLVPKLEGEALSALDARIGAAIKALPEERPANPARFAFDEAFERRFERQRLGRLRQAIADVRGDVETFIALEQAHAPERADTTAIAERLLAAGRAEEALTWLHKPGRNRLVVLTRAQLASGEADAVVPDRHRHEVEIRILEALGRRDEAQALRWSRFEQVLDPQALREHLAKLPDFEDEEVLERALAHAAAFRSQLGGLDFLIRWPRLDLAARMVIAHRTEWDGSAWQWLVPAAEALGEDHPLAASILHRALLDDILKQGRSQAYGHGARHLARLEMLAERLDPGALEPDHSGYRAGLRKAHGRKAGFWAQVQP